MLRRFDLEKRLYRLRTRALQLYFKRRYAGLTLCRPTGDEVTMRLNYALSYYRPDALRITKHCFETRVKDSDGEFHFGLGADDSEALAMQKGISEAVERFTFHALHETDRFKSTTTNGWSAHVRLNDAVSGAIGELRERDAILVHWLTATPFTRLRQLPGRFRTFGERLRASETKQNLYEVLVSHLGTVPVVMTLLRDERGFGVAGHASAPTLEEALVKSACEASRIAAYLYMDAHGTEDGEGLSEPFDHSLYYARHMPIPDWMWSGDEKSFDEVRRQWLRPAGDDSKFSFESLRVGPLWVVKAVGPHLQDLFFGPTENAIEAGLINRTRLAQLGRSLDSLNLAPHVIG